MGRPPQVAFRITSGDAPDVDGQRRETHVVLRYDVRATERPRRLTIANRRLGARALGQALISGQRTAVGWADCSARNYLSVLPEELTKCDLPCSDC